MHLVNQALIDNLVFAQLQPLFHIWSLLAPKNKMATAKMQTRGFKMAVHKPMGDFKDTTSISRGNINFYELTLQLQYFFLLVYF